MQLIGGQAQTKARVGLGFVFSAAAYNLIRLPRILEARL